MPFICENIVGNQKLLRKAEYSNVRDFIGVRTVSNPKTPLGPGWKFKAFTMPATFRKYAFEIERLEVYSDDVWVGSFPKSGTSWLTEMIWLIGNDLDYERGKEVPLKKRFPFME